MSAGTLTNLTAFGESFTAGFKRSFQSNPGAEICVFANATGGVIPPWDGNCSSGWRKRGNKHLGLPQNLWVEAKE